MSGYRRRPFLRGNADSHILTQPYIDGKAAKNASGEFAALVLSAELRLQTETMAPLSIVLTSKAMSSIVSTINSATAGAVIAKDVEGILRLTTNGTGEGAFIRILQAVLGGPITEAARILGFPVHPNETATVMAARESSSPVRPRRQQNPAGSAFLSHGEDRTASAYNRALHQITGNTDELHMMLQKRIAVPLTIEVFNNPTWAPYLVFDVNGDLDQLNLSALASIDPDWAGKLFVGGGLSNSSDLNSIAEYWSVRDSDDKEIPVCVAISGITKTVRIGAVTRGLRGTRPGFNDSSPPFPVIANTTGIAADGKNALGVARLKQTATINAVDQRTVLVSNAATFLTNGVAEDDTATISGSAVNSPFNHNGNYLVETVVSETQVVLRSADSDQVGELNPDDSAAMGTVTVRSDGSFEEGIFVTFDPPIPRFTALKMTFGVEAKLGELPVESLLRALVRSAEEVDGFVMRELWQRLSLGTAYDGVYKHTGSGFAIKVSGEPVTVVGAHGGQLNASPPASRSGVGQVFGGPGSLEILKADAADTFTTVDLGKTILLTGAPYLNQEPVVITKLIDGQSVEITGGAHRIGIILPSSASTVTYEFFDSIHSFRSAFSVILPTEFGYSGGTDPASPLGINVQREQLDEAGTSPTIPGLFGLLQLEQVRIRNGGVNIAKFTVTFNGTNKVILPFDPESSTNIQAGNSTDTKGSFAGRVPSILRIFNGIYAGYYRIHDLHSFTVTSDSVDVLTLDGATPAFTPQGITTKAAIYNIAFGTQVPTFGVPGAGSSFAAGMRVFHDGLEHGDTFGNAFSYGWRGPGGGIYCAVNDQNFKSFDNGDGANGPAIRLTLYPPATGIDIAALASTTGSAARRTLPSLSIKSKTSANDWLLVTPTTFPSYGAWLSQGGKDPSAIVTKHVGTTTFPSVGDFLPSGAMVVARAGGSLGRSGAMDIMGSLYSYRGNGTFDSGGIYTEDVMGAGKGVYPSLAGSASTGAYASRQPELGHAGQVFPEATGTTTLTLGVPDFAKFNYAHTAVYIAPVGTITDFIKSALIGCSIKVLAGIGAPYLSSQMTIVGFFSDGTGDYFAVKHPTIAVPGSPTAGITAVINGQRWYWGHVDIADWLQVGTKLLAAEPARIPTFAPGSDQTTIEASTPGPLTPDVISKITEGLLTTPLAMPVTEGEQLGRVLDLSAMPNVDVAFGSYTDGWQRDAGEPRAPFPNVGLISSNNGVLQVTSPASGSDFPGHLSSEDYALEIIAGAGSYRLGYSIVTTLSPRYGGELYLRNNEDLAPPGAGSHIVRVWQKGIRLFPRALYALKFRLTIQSSSAPVGLRQITYKLITSGGVELYSNNAPQSNTAQATPLEVETNIEWQDLSQQAYDFMEASILRGEAVHLAVDFTMNSTGLADHIRILRMQVEPLARPAYVTGGIEAVGTVRARTFRHITPVRGHETIGPSKVDLLVNQDWAKTLGNEISEPPDGLYDYGQVEGKGTGRVFNGAQWMEPVWHRSLMFHKGVNSAAIRFYHPFFDPLWYVEAGLAASADVAVKTGNTFVLPGQTGFIIPLNPPHGSRLTGFAWDLSASPCYGGTAAGDVSWQMWKKIPASLTMSSLRSAWQAKGIWDTEEGARLIVWRQHSLNHGVDYPVSAPYQTALGGNMERNYTGGTSSQLIPQSGYAEAIFAQDLSFGSVPSYTLNTDFGVERFSRGSANLQDNLFGDALAESRIRVDRRHYDYFATILVYGGLRREIAGPLNTYDGFGGTANGDQWVPLDTGVTLPSAGTIRYLGVPVSFPKGAVIAANGVGIPPFIKYRGSRLTWVTDRVGHGGW